MYQVFLTNDGARELLHETSEGSDRRVSLCQFTSGVNLIPSAEIALFPFNPCYYRINPMTSIIEIVNTKTGETEFEGRVLKIPKNGMESSGVIAKRFTCEGFMGYLYDSVQVYREFNNISAYELFSAILEYHNQNVPDEKKIYPGACDISGNIVDQSTDYAQTMSEIKRLLLQEFGGELWLRRNDQNQLVLDWLKTPEEVAVNDTTVELSKNMKSLNVDSDSTHIITRLIPLGAKLKNAETGEETGERLTIADIADGYKDKGEHYYKHGICIDDVNAIAKYGVITGTLILDDAEAREQLLGNGLQYMQNNNRIKRSYQAEVLDLSTIGADPDALEVGKAYRFVNKLIPLDDVLRLTKKTVDIFKAHKPVVEIGDKAEKITDIATRAVNFIEYEMPKQKASFLESAQAKATSLITNAVNGYIYVDNVKGELLIMDSPDKYKAQKVWRWNSGGFGFSSEGYNGKYTIAMTMDNTLVADFVMAASVIAQNLTITGGKVDISTESNTYDAIKLTYRDNSGHTWYTRYGSDGIRLDYNDSQHPYHAFFSGAGITLSRDNAKVVQISSSTDVSSGKPVGLIRMWSEGYGKWVDLGNLEYRVQVLEAKVN